MSRATTETIYTPEDLLTIPEGNRYELVDGRLVERSMGSWASYVATRLMGNLIIHVWARKLGVVIDSDASYQCFPNKRVRRPDLSFIKTGRLPDNRVPDGHIQLPPDLAVEVIFPTDLHYETDRKTQEYLDAGIPLVWTINPDVQTVLIYRADGSIIGLRESGELDGEEVVPGFRCRVAELFATS